MEEHLGKTPYRQLFLGMLLASCPNAFEAGAAIRIMRSCCLSQSVTILIGLLDAFQCCDARGRSPMFASCSRRERKVVASNLRDQR